MVSTEQQEKKEETKENSISNVTIIGENKDNEIVQGVDDEKRNSGIEYEQKNEFNAIWIVAVVAFIVTFGVIVYIKKNNKER